MKIPGFYFSWNRLLGIDKAKRKIAKETEIPMTKSGLERKVGKAILSLFKNS